MTLLGATWLSDGQFLCISDRAGLERDALLERVTDTTKWSSVKNAPNLLWGWAGSDRIGNALIPHIEDASDDWEHLMLALSEALASLCQEYPAELTECLVVGWIKDAARILKLRPNGNIHGWDPRTEPYAAEFAGAGSIGVAFAWKYASQYFAPESAGDAFRYLMRSAIAHQCLSLKGYDEWTIAPGEAPVRRHA